jgi:uncharacterized DUF497 family protein
LEFSWDEAKRSRVLAQRAIDFVDIALALLDGRPVLTSQVRRRNEDRILTVGPVDGKFFAVVWMRRDETIRIITARRARNAEEKQYRAIYI